MHKNKVPKKEIARALNRHLDEIKWMLLCLEGLNKLDPEIHKAIPAITIEDIEAFIETAGKQGAVYKARPSLKSTKTD